MSDYVRVATHKRIAPVARMMGVTSLRLIDICDRVFDEWEVIGVVRVSLGTNEPMQISARRPQWHDCEAETEEECYKFGLPHFHGALEFSITGLGAFVLTASAKERQRIRKEVAEEVVRSMRRTVHVPPVITETTEPAREQARQAEVSPYGPRDQRTY